MSLSQHRDVDHLLSLFEYQHLPPNLAVVSERFADVAATMAEKLGTGAELIVGLRKLLEAKDCFVRQAVIDARTRS